MVQLHVTQSSVIRYLNSSSQVKESLNGHTFFVAAYISRIRVLCCTAESNFVMLQNSSICIVVSLSFVSQNSQKELFICQNDKQSC